MAMGNVLTRVRLQFSISVWTSVPGRVVSIDIEASPPVATTESGDKYPLNVLKEVSVDDTYLDDIEKFYVSQDLNEV